MLYVYVNGASFIDIQQFLKIWLYNRLHIFYNLFCSIIVIILSFTIIIELMTQITQICRMQYSTYNLFYKYDRIRISIFKEKERCSILIFI